MDNKVNGNFINLKVVQGADDNLKQFTYYRAFNINHIVDMHPRRVNTQQTILVNIHAKMYVIDERFESITSLIKVWHEHYLVLGKG